MFCLRVFVVVAMLVMLQGCGDATQMPALPTVDTSELRPVARAHIDEATEAAAANEAAVANLAMVLHAYQLFPQAETAYRRARLRRPSDRLLAYAHGRALQQIGRLDDAMVAFEAAGEDQRFAELACARLMECELAGGEVTGARDRALRCLKVSPDSGALLALGARAAWQAGDEARATQWIRHAEELGLRHPSLAYTDALIARAGGNDELAATRMAQFRRLRNLNVEWPDPLMDNINRLRRTARSRVADVQMRLSAGLARREAIELLEAAIAQDPEAYEAHALLVGLYGAVGNLVAAEAHFDAAVALAPTAAQLYFNLAVARSEAGLDAAALEQFDQALALAPDHANARALRARTLYRLGRRGEALAQFTQAVAQDPANATVRQVFAGVLLNERDYDAAAEVLAVADPSPAEDARRLLLLSRVQRAAGRFAAAEAALADARLAAAFLSDPGVDEALRRESELLQRRRRD